jgi:methyltransferase
MMRGIWAYILLMLLAGERGFEILTARRNEAWIRLQGGREYAASFSKLIFAFHAAWFVSFAIEAYWRGALPLVSPPSLIAALLLLQCLRYWCIVSLGRFWNTKVLVLPGASIVRRGPYRLLRHPNYLVVLIEIPLYPALLGCWFTALLFGIVNTWVLRARIRQEEGALRENTDFHAK